MPRRLLCPGLYGRVGRCSLSLSERPRLAGRLNIEPKPLASMYPSSLARRGVASAATVRPVGGNVGMMYLSSSSSSSSSFSSSPCGGGRGTADRRRLLMTVMLMSFITALSTPRGGVDAVHFSWREGNEVRPSRRRLDVINTVVERECIERETNESVGINEMIEEGEKKTPLPKRLFNVLKSFFGRSANVILSRSSLKRPNDDAGRDDELDHTFDDLDRIIESTNNTKNDELLQHQHLNDVDGGGEFDDDGWLSETFWPPLSQGSSFLSGRKQQRSLLHRMNKVRNTENSLMLSP